jgi:uncharacterized membrane protein
MTKLSFLSHRFLLKLIIGGCVVAAASILLQVWFDVFSNLLLSKILITCGVVIVLAGLLKAIAADMDEESKDKKDTYYN